MPVPPRVRRSSITPPDPRLPVKLSILPLSLLLLLGSCGEEGTVAAKEALAKAGEAAQATASSFGEKFKDVDWSGLAPEKLKEMGGEAVTAITTKLGEIKDSETAESVANTVKPLLEKGGATLKALGDKLPGRADLKVKVDELATQFEGNEGVMKHLGPVLEKLSEILG